MATRTIAIIVSTVVLSFAMLTNKTLADGPERAKKEIPAGASDPQVGAEVAMPIPNAPEMDEQDSPAITLELRVANTVCPHSVYLLDFPRKCQTASPSR